MIRGGGALLALALLGGCAGLAALPGLGGPKIAANVQAGPENRQAVIDLAPEVRQTLVRPEARTIKQTGRDTGVEAETVRHVEIRHEAPPWVWGLVAVFSGLAAAAVALMIDDVFDRRRARRAAAVLAVNNGRVSNG